MQRKVFRVEQMFSGGRASALARQPRDGKAHAPAEPAMSELAQMRDIVARHRRDLSALIDDGKARRMTRAAGELGAAVDGMEKATEKVLKAAETIDDGARALATTLKGDYERGITQDIQDHVVQIYEACNFQDLAGQRIGKVVATLHMVEEQLAAMLARCGGGKAERPAGIASASGHGLINGPRLDGDSGHASQRDIDKMFG